MQVGTTKDQGLYNKPSAAVHPETLAAGTLPQYTIQYLATTRNSGFHILRISLEYCHQHDLISKNLKTATHRTLMVADVLCGRETWFLTLRVFGNRVLRKIVGPKMNEITWNWRRLHCIAVGSWRLMPPDALQPKACCTNPGL